MLFLGASDRTLWLEKGASVLIGAVQEGREGVLGILLDGDIDAVGGAISKAIRTAVRKGEARILHRLLGVVEEEKRALWAREISGGVPLLSHATAAGSLGAVNILLRAGARENVGLAGNLPGECIGAALAGRVDPAQGAAIARTLSRGPAYRARSRAWPVEVGVESGSTRAPRGVPFFGRVAAGSSQHVPAGEGGSIVGDEISGRRYAFCFARASR